MTKVTLTGVYRDTTDRDGNPLVSGPNSKNPGTPYTRLKLKTQEHGDKYLSGFGNQSNSGWKVGDVVEIEVKQNGEYLNFDTPKVAKQNFASDEVMKTKIGKMATDIEYLTGVVEEIRDAIKVNEINPDDIPL